MIFSLFVVTLTGVIDSTLGSLIISDFNTSFFTLGFCVSVIIFFELPQELREINRMIKTKDSHSLKLVIFFFGGKDS